MRFNWWKFYTIAIIGSLLGWLILTPFYFIKDDFHINPLALWLGASFSGLLHSWEPIEEEIDESENQPS